MPNRATRPDGPTPTQLGVYALIWAVIVWVGALIALVILDLVEILRGPTP